MTDNDVMCVLGETLDNWDSGHAETAQAQIAVLSALLAKEGFPASYRDDVTMLVRRTREALQPLKERARNIRIGARRFRALEGLMPQPPISRRRVVSESTTLGILLMYAEEDMRLPKAGGASAIGPFYLDVAEPLLRELPEAPEAMRILRDLRQVFQDLAVAQKSVELFLADLRPVLASLQEKVQVSVIRTAL